MEQRLSDLVAKCSKQEQPEMFFMEKKPPTAKEVKRMMEQGAMKVLWPGKTEWETLKDPYFKVVDFPIGTRLILAKKWFIVVTP